MNKKLNKIFKIFVIVIFITIGVFSLVRYYVYHGGKRDIKSEEAVFKLNSKEIIGKFISNEAHANAKYLEKPLAISGKITSINGKEVILDEVVVCGFVSIDNSLQVGQDITVKGRVIGYDDLMGNVNMDQCSINK